jgi:NhaC family Na+:H+ antiporter
LSTAAPVKVLPSITTALLVCFGVIATMLVGIVVYRIPIQVLLLVAIVVTAAVSMRHGYSTDELIGAMSESLSRAMVAMLIFILIGAIIGAWIHSGTVPALIYYGLNLLSADYFLPAGLIICSVTSLVTGTSWGTAGTVGLALMGIGIGMGFPAPVVAGMVISGAYFGDKMSPLSDTCILAAAAAETDIYKHIVGMSYTTIPAYLICFIAYLLMSFHYAPDSQSSIAEVANIQAVLDGRFNLTPFVLLPALLLIVLIVMKVHPVTAILFAALSGILVAVIFQDSGVVSALTAINNGYTEKTGHKLVDAILLKGGIQSMMWTFSLAFLALCLGGMLEKVGFVQVLIEKAMQRITSVNQMVPMVIGTTFLSNVAMGTNYMSIILNGAAYRNAFDKLGLHRKLLSRLLEEGGTQTAALVPWSTAGAFMAATLGVATFSYAPYTLLNLINPVLSIVLAGFGVFVFKAVREKA